MVELHICNQQNATVPVLLAASVSSACREPPVEMTSSTLGTNGLARHAPVVHKLPKADGDDAAWARLAHQGVEHAYAVLARRHVWNTGSIYHWKL